MVPLFDKMETNTFVQLLYIDIYFFYQIYIIDDI